jgi:hypothetical protein
MVPYREKKQRTTSSGFRHPDSLEVSRTTSNNSMSSHSDSPTLLSAANAVFECDYDTNPTVLYQAIEAKQWDYAISLFTNRGNINNNNNNNKKKKDDDEEEEEEASATWVVRKEANGKLRWRLLPLHAAIIFGSPLKLIELLLMDYPLAAQCKDDRGMLPLHLAFRKQASWDVIDELLTIYPLAAFVSDRKGRTPLTCGVSKISLPQQQQNNTNNPNLNTTVIQPVGSGISGVNGRLSDGSSFRTVAGVLELYSQIVISGERKRVEQETRTLAQTSISQILDSHFRQLEAMRKKKESDKAETKQQTEQLERENKELQERLHTLENELAERDQSHLDMTKELQLTNDQLDLANERAAEANASSPNSSSTNAQHQNTIRNKSIDKMLRMMAETMVRQQKAYHGRVQELLTNYQELVTEREAVRSIFLKESTAQQQKETVMLESFRNWFREEGKKLSLQERSLLSSSLSSPSADCRTDFEKKNVERNESPVPVVSCDPMVPNNRATDEATKATPTTIPTVQEKVRPDPVPTISSTDIATTATYVEQRQEPRELGVL